MSTSLLTRPKIRKGHTDPNQAENTKKVTSIEANQTQIMGILSSLKDDNNTMQERLETIKSNVTPKFSDAAAKNLVTPRFLDAAARNIVTPKIHDAAASKPGNFSSSAQEGAAGNSDMHKISSCPIASTGMPPASLDDVKTRVTRPTPVLNSPVKKESPQGKPHFNKMTPMGSVSSTLPPTGQSNPGNIKKRKLYTKTRTKSRRTPSPTQVPSLPTTGEMYETMFQWVSGVFSNIMANSKNASLGIVILMAVLLTPTQASPIHSPSSILSSLQPSPYRTVYPLLEMETRTWAYQIE